MTAGNLRHDEAQREAVRSYRHDVLKRVEHIKQRYPMTVLGEVEAPSGIVPIVAFRIERDPKLPEIYLQGGIHGDEPAPVYALLDFLERGVEEYPSFNFTIIPCVNPSGFELGTHATMRGVDINKDFTSEEPQSETAMLTSFINGQGRRYLAAVDLHEDKTDQEVARHPVEDNPRGLYLYESSPSPDDSLAHPIMEHLRESYPVHDGGHVYGDASEGGVIREATTGVPLPEDDSFDGFINMQRTYGFTLETPTSWDLHMRVAAHTDFIHAVLGTLVRKA